MTIVATVPGVVLSVLVATYLFCMMRLASLLVQETDVTGVGISGATSQMKLLRVIFLKHDLEEAFAIRHTILLACARWTGGVAFVLSIAVLIATLFGYAG